MKLSDKIMLAYQRQEFKLTKVVKDVEKTNSHDAVIQTYKKSLHVIEWIAWLVIGGLFIVGLVTGKLWLIGLLPFAGIYLLYLPGILRRVLGITDAEVVEKKSSK